MVTVSKSMHRVQIKQFPIKCTHWWPKTRNERFVWENERYSSSSNGVLWRLANQGTVFISFLPLVHNHVQVIWGRVRFLVCDVCAHSGLVCASAGSDLSRVYVTHCLHWDFGSVTFHCEDLNIFRRTGNRNGRRFRYINRLRVLDYLRRLSQNECTRHTPGSTCALRSLGRGCVQEVQTI